MRIRNTTCEYEQKKNKRISALPVLFRNIGTGEGRVEVLAFCEMSALACEVDSMAGVRVARRKSAEYKFSLLKLNKTGLNKNENE